MVRENGYIKLDDILNDMGIDTTSLDTVKKSDKVIVEDGSSDVFSFKCNNVNLFFKTNPIRNEYNYYAELFAEELAKDFGIPCAQYDLAKVCGNIGVISTDIKKENVKYTDLKDIIEKYHYDLWDNFDLLTIWDDLNAYYKDYENRKKIVNTLVAQIVDVFIFDILICQLDPSNLMIMESDGNVSLAPIFDNEFMQYEGKEYAFNFGVDEKIVPVDRYAALSAFDRFLNISSNEYVNKVVDKMWIIGETNLKKKFDIIERKIKYPVPDDIKNKFITRFANYRKSLIGVLNKYIDVPIVESKKIK